MQRDSAFSHFAGWVGWHVYCRTMTRGLQPRPNESHRMSQSPGTGRNGPGRHSRLLWLAGLAIGVAGGALVAVTLVSAATPA